MIDRILVPLDGSAEAEAAIPYAAGLATAFDSDVIMLRVVEQSHRLGAHWTDPVEWRLARTEAMRYLEEIATRIRPAAKSVDLDVGAGPAAEEILETARTRRADLLVMTTHGKGGTSEFPLASTAHKVASTAEISLLIVPTGAPAPAGSAGPVVVPLDGSQRAEWSLRLAATLARSLGVDLVVAHAIRRPEVLALEASDQLRRLSDEYVRVGTVAAQRYLDATVQRLVAPDLPHRTRVCVCTSVPRAIEELAGDEGAYLVVLSAHGITGSDASPFGTVAGGFLSRARCPVLVLQDRPADGSTGRTRWSSTARRDRTGETPEIPRIGQAT